MAQCLSSSSNASSSVATVNTAGLDQSTLCKRPYTYTPIHGDQIRLLLLAPGSGLDELVADFYVVSSVQAPKYRAISYAWGVANYNERLLFGKHQFLVITSSLTAVLHNFRDPIECTILWADAVCINQQDDGERSRQVEMMGLIYQRASEVLIWLGHATDTDPLAFWAMGRLDKYEVQSHSAVNNDQVSWVLEYERLSDFLLQSPECGPIKKQCPCCSQEADPTQDSWTIISAIVHVLESPWFGRLWVLQEVAVAQEATFFRGRHHISVNKLMDTVAVLSDVAAPYGTSIAEIGWYEGNVTQVRMMLCDKRTRWQLGVETSDSHMILSMLLDTLHMHAKDTRDRLWATRALTSAVSSLRPDYSMQAEELWKRLALYLLRSPQDMYIHPAVVLALRTPAIADSSATLPSWVPDFGRLGPDNAGKAVWYNALMSPSIKRVHAGGHAHFTAEESPAGSGVLSVRAAKVSEIDVIGRETYRKWPSAPVANMEDMQRMYYMRDVLVPWYLKCQLFFEDFANPDLYPGFEQAFSALLTQGQEMQNDFAYKMCEENPMHKAGHVQLWRVLCRRAMKANVALQRLAVDVNLMRHTLQPFFLPYFNIVPWDRDRVLAASSYGHIGWVPTKAALGDSIYLLQGAPYPFVLRLSDDRSFCIIGDAYVQGVMDGEAWPNDESQVQTIKLV